MIAACAATNTVTTETSIALILSRNTLTFQLAESLAQALSLSDRVQVLYS